MFGRGAGHVVRKWLWHAEVSVHSVLPVLWPVADRQRARTTWDPAYPPSEVVIWTFTDVRYPISSWYGCRSHRDAVSSANQGKVPTHSSKHY